MWGCDASFFVNLHVLNVTWKTEKPFDMLMNVCPMSLCQVDRSTQGQRVGKRKNGQRMPVQVNAGTCAEVIAKKNWQNQTKLKKKKSKKNSKNLTISKNPTQSQDIKLYKGNNRLRHPKIKKTRAVEFTIVHASAGLKAPQKNSNILKKNKTLKTWCVFCGMYEPVGAVVCPLPCLT